MRPWVVQLPRLLGHRVAHSWPKRLVSSARKAWRSRWAARRVRPQTPKRSRKGFTMSAGLLATTPTWATILVASITGLFGLLAGASVAAVVTTSHERRERFRERMIVAASDFVAAAGKPYFLLREAHFAVEAPRAVASGKIPELPRPPETHEQELSSAREGIRQAELETRKAGQYVPPLQIFFRGSQTSAYSVPEEALLLLSSLLVWHAFLDAFLSPSTDFSAEDSKSLDDLLDQTSDRWDSFLGNVNESISRRVP